MSRFAHRIPLVRASNRAFITFLNRIRADSFDALVENLSTEGKPLTDVELKALGNYVNVATGRGDLGKFTAGAEGLATVFFSPRLVASRFQYLFGQPFMQGTGRTQKAIAKEYGRALTALAVVYGLGSLAGATIEEDPRSSDLGKMRFGRTRLDPMAGLSQTAVISSKTGATAINMMSRWLADKTLISGEKKTLRGRLEPLSGPRVKFGRDDIAGEQLRFLRTKFSPVLGTAIDLLAQQNVVGQPVTPGDVFGKLSTREGIPLPGTDQKFKPGTLYTPLTFQNVYDVLREQGVSRGMALWMLSEFGMGLQYYEPNKNRH